MRSDTEQFVPVSVVHVLECELLIVLSFCSFCNAASTSASTSCCCREAPPAPGTRDCCFILQRRCYGFALRNLGSLQR